jgi:uncharacterized protein
LFGHGGSIFARGILAGMKCLRVFTLLVVAVSCLASGIGAMARQASAPAVYSGRTGEHPPAIRAWFVRIILPRPTFDKDMTPAEAKLMHAHHAYWLREFKAGVCVFGGPIFDSKGQYGVVVILALNEDEARAIASDDPSVKAGLNRVEITEMQIAFPPKKS